MTRTVKQIQDELIKPKRVWVIRTIRRGTVKIFGNLYRVDERHMAYDGRLDGMRYMFGRYWQEGGCCPFVCLWGSEEASRDEGILPLEGPHVVDGSLPWYWWLLVEEKL